MGLEQPSIVQPVPAIFMPTEPTIVPPTPVINQGQDAALASQVQQIFDRVAPEIKTAPTPPEQKPPVVPAQTTPAQEATAPPAEVLPPKEEPPKVPSFLEKMLTVEPKAEGGPPPAQTPAEEEFPEELPTFTSDDERKMRYKKWRDAYQAAKKEAEGLRNRPLLDDATRTKLQFLENQNKEMAGALNRVSVETHQDFQQHIIRPMQAAWGEAARIVQESGGSTEDLARALGMTGKAHFEALDSVFSDLPESAKAEAHNAVSAYRRLDQTRRAALADAPRTIEVLKRQDIVRQHEFLQRQKMEMQNLFDDAVRVLRDEAKVEVLQTSADPDSKWWNDQAAALVDLSKKLYLDNTDMRKMALACIMAPMADTYRKLWLQERQQRTKTQKIMRDRFGSEPNLQESGGNFSSSANTQEDLKKPFADVFLREFHRQRNAGAR